MALEASNNSSGGIFDNALYKELWHACAGPLVDVPREGERVYYFPQGHMEQEIARQLCLEHQLLFSKMAQYTGVKTKEWLEVNSRGLEIFSKSWFLEDSPTKALVCFCHGYGDTCTFLFEGIAKKLASSGYGVFRLDYPGFGLSEGLHGYIASFDNLVDDVVEHFSKIKENPEYRGLPSFLFGESMGGAVALKVHFKQPHGWNGAILVVPMCKMADDVVPPWPVQQVLIGLAKFFPKEKLVPQKNLTEMAFKDLKKREQIVFLCFFNGISKIGRFSG